MKKIQIYIISNGEERISNNIWEKVKFYFNIEIHRVTQSDLLELIDKKVHMIIFDNLLIKNIMYSLIDKIQKNNKHLYTAYIGNNLSQNDLTKIYDNHIDYTFVSEYDDKYFISKLKTILKRTNDKYLNDVDLSFKNITVYRALGEIKVDDSIVDTSKKEYKLIKLLIENQDKFISKHNILKNIWGYEEDTSRVVDQYLHKIKKKIGSSVTIVSDRKQGVRII